MKRRKKFWVACGVAIVVLLCSAALITGPKPYEFLLGAEPSSAMIITGSATAASSRDILRMRYILDGTYEGALNAARLELRPEDGWVWTSRRPLHQKVTHSGKARTVSIYRMDTRINGAVRQGHVIVETTRPATLLDRVIGLVRKR